MENLRSHFRQANDTICKLLSRLQAGQFLTGEDCSTVLRSLDSLLKAQKDFTDTMKANGIDPSGCNNIDLAEKLLDIQFKKKQRIENREVKTTKEGDFQMDSVK